MDKDRQETEAAWRKIGSDLGLNYESSGYPVLRGTWENHRVAITVFKESGDSIAKVCTGFELHQKHIFNTSFELKRQKLFQSLLGAVGQKDIQIGDASFDDTVLVEGWDEKAVQDLLQCENVRKACLTLFSNSRFREVLIDNRKVLVSISGIVRHPPEVNSILLHLLKVAVLFEQESSRIDDVPIEVPVEQPVVEVELPAIEEKVLEEPEIEQPGPEIDPFSVPNVAAVLGSRELSKTDAEQKFSEYYKGKSIYWKCDLNHILSGGDHQVFGSDCGWIANCDAGLLNAVYRFGQQRKDSYDKQPASELEIEGTLFAFDWETKTLFIDSGDAREEVNSYSATVVISL